MRRRRRSQGTWLPILGTVPGEGEATSTIRLALNIPGAAGPEGSILGIIPITYDVPQETDLVPEVETLGEIITNEYFLKRIVGKCHAGVTELGGGTPSTQLWPDFYLVTCGFFIARAQDENTGTGSNLPIGGLVYDQYGPDAFSTIREPWIWRRQWCLGSQANQLLQLANQADAGTTGICSPFFPTTTSGYGSVLDGPHIDAKTKRRVGQDDRLWFAISARAGRIFDTSTLQATLKINLDVRLFAQLRRAKNTGNF